MVGLIDVRILDGEIRNRLPVKHMVAQFVSDGEALAYGRTSHVDNHQGSGRGLDVDAVRCLLEVAVSGHDIGKTVNNREDIETIAAQPVLCAKSLSSLLALDPAH
jgi:hypothetical protein